MDPEQLKKPAVLDLHCLCYIMFGFILFLKELIHVYCLSTVMASLRSLCNMFFDMGKCKTFFGQGQVSTFAISTSLLHDRTLLHER